MLKLQPGTARVDSVTIRRGVSNKGHFTCAGLLDEAGIKTPAEGLVIELDEKLLHEENPDYTFENNAGVVTYVCDGRENCQDGEVDVTLYFHQVLKGGE